MSDFFDRLDIFMRFSNLNDNQITVQAGLSIGSIGKQRKGSRGLSSDSIAKLLCAFPHLNAQWLLIGKGEMLNSEIVKDPKDAEINELLREKIELLKEKIESLEKKGNV